MPSRLSITLLLWTTITRYREHFHPICYCPLPRSMHPRFHSSTRDVLYLATLKIDGVDYQLQMDTGSSDLWVNTTMVPTTLVRVLAFIPSATASHHASPRTLAHTIFL